jgi:hypothetical protein
MNWNRSFLSLNDALRYHFDASSCKGEENVLHFIFSPLVIT